MRNTTMMREMNMHHFTAYVRSMSISLYFFMDKDDTRSRGNLMKE